MSWREFYEKSLKKWSARILIAFVLLTVAIHIAHLLDYLKWIPEHALLETVVFASFFAIILLLETFSTSDKKLDDLSRESKSEMALVSQRLNSLSQQVDATTGIATYVELPVFQQKWQNLREKFDSVMLVGELPLRYPEEVKWICEQDQRDQQTVKERELSVYRSLNTSSRQEIIELIELSAAARSDLVQLYHMYGFEWGSWAMGRNHRGDVEVLLNYANAHGNALVGLHLSGKAAESFDKAITRHLGEVGLPGVSYPSVRLFSREQVDFIVEEKVEYQKKIKEMADMGVPIEGRERICEVMSNILEQNTKCYLDVTHLCDDEGQIQELKSEPFQKWLDANYKAVQQGVQIKRIFIVRKEHYNHSILVQTIQQMQSNKIEVLKCRLDYLQSWLQEDFSIYDGQHLVYIDKTRIPWSPMTQPESLARRTQNPRKIKEYREIFDALKSHAEPV